MNYAIPRTFRIKTRIFFELGPHNCIFEGVQKNAGMEKVIDGRNEVST